MNKTLTMIEEIGTKIKHKKVGTIVIITGSDCLHFFVEEPDINLPLALPFKNLNDWEVIQS